MEIHDWLIAFIPILSFGLMPVIGTFIGGKPSEQSMGIALGGFVFSLAVLLCRHPEMAKDTFIIGFISGASWAVGSVCQFQGIRYLGVARSTPIINGGQIIGTSLVGVMLGDWASQNAKVYGFIALALIIAGIVLTSYKEDKGGEKPEWSKGILINLLGALGFTAYVGVLKYYAIDGYSSILPQSVGQIVTIFILGVIFFKTYSFSFKAVKNGLNGIIWGIGNIALLLSQIKIGLSVAYPISQAAIIISVLGGVFINKEHKTKKEWAFTGTGIAVICIGLFMIYLSAKY